MKLIRGTKVHNSSGSSLAFHPKLRAKLLYLFSSEAHLFQKPFTYEENWDFEVTVFHL